MTSASSPKPAAPKRSALAFITWWNPDPAEVEKQLAGYDTLRVWQSARGMSMLLCAFSVTVTVLLGRFLHLSSGTIATEVILWSTLGLFMYRGHRWAFIAGMVMWTIEKIALVIEQAGSGRAPITQIIFWFVYMAAFYLAFTVERTRAGASVPAR
jgi:hypothetical protein